MGSQSYNFYKGIYRGKSLNSLLFFVLNLKIVLKIRKNLQSCRDIFKAVWIICQIVAQVSYQIYHNTICRRFFVLGMNSIATQLIRVY